MTNSFTWNLVGLGFLWRLLIASQTVVPSEDGANYLWMAERFAAGDATGALGEVFPPLLSLLLAPLVWLGADPFRGGQLLLAVAGALAVIPILRASDVLLPGSGRWAGCMAMFAALPVKYAAEIYTEPLFLLIGGLAFWAGVCNRVLLMGLASGLAFWVRPEAALLPVAFFLARRSSWPAFVPVGLSVLILMCWRALCGHGWIVVGKLSNIWERSVFQADGLGDGLLRFADHVVQLPLLYLEAFTLVGILALVAAVRHRNGNTRPVLWLWLLVTVVVAMFLPRRRFLVGWLFTIAPLAAMGLASLPHRRHLHLWVVGIVILLNLVLGLRVTEANREAEQLVGHFLKRQMTSSDRLTSDMTRVRYFAGRRPNPPEHMTVEYLVESGRGSRFVVLGSRRDKTAEVLERLPNHRPVELPEEIRALAEDRGILVLERGR